MALGIYAALPPEVNVGRLLAGAGSAPMFAVAAGYAAIAQAAATLAAASDAQVHSLMTTWRGAAADGAIPAFLRHATWLREFAALAQTTAAQATAVANAYVSAVATSPTIPELAMNRVSLFTLIATNILGINTVPIGVTEADYMRMWGQAAGAMSTYDAAAASNSTLTAPQQAPAILSQLVGMLSSLTGPLSSLASSANQDNQSEAEGLQDAHPDGELLASVPSGFLGTVPSSSMLAELRSGGTSVAAPRLTRGGLDEMSGTATGFLLPGNWAQAASAAGDPAGTRLASATNAPGGPPLGAVPLSAVAPVSAARPGPLEVVSPLERHEVVPAVAVIDVGDDDEVPA